MSFLKKLGTAIVGAVGIGLLVKGVKNYNEDLQKAEMEQKRREEEYQKQRELEELEQKRREEENKRRKIRLVISMMVFHILNLNQ